MEIGLVALAIGMGATPGVAADADALIAQGLNLRKDGHDEAALPFFRQAFEQQPTPRAAGQLGTCEQALGLWVGAERHIQEALSHPQDPWVQKSEAPLRSSLAYVQQRLGSIEVWGRPVGARVSVEGEFVASLPMRQAARAAVGRRAITVEAPGFLPESLTLEVVSGALVREHVALRSIVGTTTSPEVSAGNVLAMEQRPISEPAGGQPGPDDPPNTAGTEFYRRWWFWAAIGAVAVVGGATVYLLATKDDGCNALMGGTCSRF